MSITTKFRLFDPKVYQATGDTLSLSGVTNFGHAKYLEDKSSEYVARSIPDVDFVTGNTIYDLTSPATKAVGGVSIGDTLVGKTSNELLSEILAPFIQPTFSSFVISVPSIIEVGSATLAGNKTFTWGTTTSGNVAPASIGIKDLSGAVDLISGLTTSPQVVDIGTIANATPITQTWQITGSSTNDVSFARNEVVSSIYPIYYGKVADGGSRPGVDQALINTGTKQVISSTGTVSVTFNSTDAEYTWLAIPQISPSKNRWYVDALNAGDMLTKPIDKYPDECIIPINSPDTCWSSINYKIYMSGTVGEATSPIQFRNS